MCKKQDEKVKKIIDDLDPIKSLRLDTIKVLVINNENQEIWAYGFENGIPHGASNKSLDFTKIVKIIETALDQAKCELSIADDTN